MYKRLIHCFKGPHIFQVQGLNKQRIESHQYIAQLVVTIKCTNTSTCTNNLNTTQIAFYLNCVINLPKTKQCVTSYIRNIKVILRIMWITFDKLIRGTLTRIQQMYEPQKCQVLFKHLNQLCSSMAIHLSSKKGKL